MNRARIEQLLASYGADTARWPPNERAEVLLARDASTAWHQHDPLLEQAYSEASELDAALAALDVPEVDDLRARRLEQRVLAHVQATDTTANAFVADRIVPKGAAPLARAAQPTRHSTAVTGPRRLWWPAIAAAVPLLLGFSFGMFDTSATSSAGTRFTSELAAADEETQYANEATMAQYVFTAHLEPLTGSLTEELK